MVQNQQLRIIPQGVSAEMDQIAVRPGSDVDIDRHILPIDLHRLDIPFRLPKRCVKWPTSSTADPAIRPAGVSPRVEGIVDRHFCTFCHQRNWRGPEPLHFV